MPSNTVDIYFKGHNSGLTRSISEVQAQLRSLKDSRIQVKVDVDTAALTRLRTQLNSFRNETVRIRVATDDARGLRQNLRDVASRREANVRVNITNLQQVRAQLDSLTRDRTVRVRVNVDQSQIRQMADAIRRLQQLGDGGGLGNAARGVSAIGGAAAGTLPKLLALAPAVSVLASGAAGAGIFGVAGALGAVTAAAGALSVGFGAAVAAIPIAAAATSQKVKDHFSFMADDVVATMKEIAVPLQEPLVGLATAVGAAFHQIRPNLENITAGVAGLVNQLSGQMPAIAAQVGPALEKMFQGAVPHIQNLINNLPRLVQSFGNFAAKLGDPAIVQGAQRVFAALPGLIEGAGSALVDLGQKFNSVMAFLDAGKLDGFTNGISAFIEKLGSTDWSGVVQGLSDMANSFGDFVANIDTENLAANLEGLTSGIAEITNATSGFVQGFQAADEALRNFAAGVNSDIGLDGMLDGILMPDGISDKINQFLDDIGLIEWDGPKVQANPTVDVAPGADPTALITSQLTGDPVEIPVTPKINPLDGLNGLLGGAPLEVPVTPTVEPGNLPPIPLLGTVQDVEPPITGPIPIPLLGQVETITPPVVPLAPIQIPAEVQTLETPPAPLAPVEVPATIASVDVNLPNIPPVKVPVEYDTAALGNLVIQPPPPVMVPVQIDVSAASAAVAQLGQLGVQAGQSFADGVASSAGAVSAAVGTLASAAQSVSVNLSSQGAAAGASFAAGIRSQAGAVAAAARHLGAVAQANKGYYKGRKGIAADKIMLIPHGQALVGGFIRGMESQSGDVASTARGVAKNVYRAFDDELVPNIGLSGGATLTQKVYVQVDAGMMADPVKIGRDVADALNAYGSAVGKSTVVVNV